MVTPDLGNVPPHIESKLNRRGRCEYLLCLHRLDDKLTSRQSRSLDGELSHLNETDIQEILNQSAHSRCRTVDDLNRILRAPVRLRLGGVNFRTNVCIRIVESGFRRSWATTPST